MTGDPQRFLRREGCPVCGMQDGLTLFQAPLTGGALGESLRKYYWKTPDLTEWLSDGVLQVDECGGCGLVFQRFVGAPALLDALYDGWVNARDPGDDPEFRFQLEHPMWSRDGHEIVAASRVRRRPLQELRVLDYGMGWGLWAQIARKVGARVFGYDLSEVRRRYVASKGVELVELADIPSLRLDFINTEQVFEHLPDPLQTARTLSAALAPGGILKISVPRADDIAHRLRNPDWAAPKSSRRSLHPIQPLEHVNCFNVSSLARLAREAGLTPVRIPASAYFAFVRVRGGVPRDPLRFAKAIARPLYHALSKTNLYMWFTRLGG